VLAQQRQGQGQELLLVLLVLQGPLGEEVGVGEEEELQRQGPQRLHP
jgi:hypothetical protein